MLTREFVLLIALMLVALMTAGPDSLRASAQRVCFGCTNDDCGGKCACFAAIFTTCNGHANQTCGALTGPGH